VSMDSPVVETVIGLFFVFATFAALVSVITESITRFLGLRGEYLLRGLRSLLDGRSTFKISMGDLLGFSKKTSDGGLPMVTQVMNHPLIARSADQSEMPSEPGNVNLTNVERRRLPPYVSGRTFATVMIDTLVPNTTGTTTLTQVESAVRADLGSNPGLQKALLALLATAGNDLDAFRTQLEQWYDDQMARVSGWYKRHVRWISLGIAVVLVLAFNLSALKITTSLYSDQALSGTVVTAAANASHCQTSASADCLQKIRTEISTLSGAGLPFGWDSVSACSTRPAAQKCNWPQRHGLWSTDGGTGSDIIFILLLLVGWALMTAAMLPGARFWFDALSKLGTLRSAGPKPASS
jgi:hypothetical protein